MQRNDFDLFCQANHTAIERIKNNLAKLPKLLINSEIWETTLSQFFDFRKKFIYLCAALLREGADYALIYKKIFVDVDNFSDLLEEKDITDLYTKFSFIPLLAYSVCSFEDMQTWFHDHRDKEQKNPFVQMINRTIACANFNFCCFEGDYIFTKHAWNERGGDFGFKNAKNQLLDMCSEYAQSYPDLMHEIQLLHKQDLEIQHAGSLVTVSGLTKLLEMMLKINNHQLNNMPNNNRSRLDIYKSSLDSNLTFFRTEVCGPIFLNIEENTVWKNDSPNNNVNDRSGPGYGF